MSLIKKNDFDELVSNIYHTHCIMQANAAKAINYNLTVRNWIFYQTYPPIWLTVSAKLENSNKLPSELLLSKREINQ